MNIKKQLLIMSFSLSLVSGLFGMDFIGINPNKRLERNHNTILRENKKTTIQNETKVTEVKISSINKPVKSIGSTLKNSIGSILKKAVSILNKHKGKIIIGIIMYGFYKYPENYAEVMIMIKKMINSDFLPSANLELCYSAEGENFFGRTITTSVCKPALEMSFKEIFRSFFN